MLALLVAVLAVSGCGFFGPYGFFGKDPTVASLPPVFGARVTDGQLRLWTGTPCEGLSEVSVTFSPGNGRLILEPPAGRVADVEYLTVDGANPGLNVTEALPAGFDWRTFETVLLIVDATEGAGSTPTNIAEIIAGSDDHPDDTFYFQGIGWLNPAQVAEQNEKSLLTVCTADPATAPSLPSAFGARVTDGTLRIWTGSPCTSAYGVTLIFTPNDPGAAGIPIAMYAPDGSTVDLERLTFGDPLASGLEPTTRPPDDFDWRAMQSLTLYIHRPEIHREATTQLRAVIDESARHPEDTYWFDGIGWLDPAEVADQDGKTFLGPCTPDPGR